MSQPEKFDFYPAAFLIGTATMSAEDVGTYIRLLCHEWSSGPLPAQKSSLVRMLGGDVPSAAVLDKFAANIDGRLVNTRLETERSKSPRSRRKPVDVSTAPYSDDFESWWKVYPRNGKKLDAWRAWPKAIAIIRQRNDWPDPTAVDWLIQVTKRFVASPKGKGDFVPHGSTFLNARRFDDDPEDWKRDGTRRSGTSTATLFGREQQRESEQQSVIAGWAASRTLPGGGLRKGDGAPRGVEADGGSDGS